MPLTTLLARATRLLIVLYPSLALSAPRASTLPLTHVRFYETGVGYFERAGALPAGEVSLPVPAGHLDDALKTLVVLGSGVRVDGVAFSSSVSRNMAQKLAGLPEGGEAPLGISELARSFKGADVTLATTSGSYRGRLVEVLEPGQGQLERCSAPHGSSESTEASSACRLVEQGSLVLFTSSGELRRLIMSEVQSLRPSEPAARARLNAALDALSQRGAQTRRELGVVTSSGGKVTLGYVAEAPVWRSTYRIVLLPEHARIQGWALLHNDTDEDWRGVGVDLVNGRPTSFLYPLAAPRYVRRELVTPPEELSSVPQLFDTTVDNLWTGETPGLTGAGYGYGSARGEGIGLGRLGTLGHGAGPIGDVASSELSIGNLASLAPAEGIEAAALFRYTLPSKLSLRAHASALVPFLDTAIKVRRVAWFGVGADAAASALHVTNDTKQTLPAGTLAVFGDGGFAGEALLARSKPSESHLLSYGLDLDVELERRPGAAREAPRLFGFDGERLQRHYVRHRSESLTLTNRSGSARTVYVELGVVENAKVLGATELGYDHDSKKTYCVLQVPARAEQAQVLELEEALERSYEFSSLSSGQLRSFALAPTTRPAQRATLLRAAEQLLSAERRRGAEPRRRAELEQALTDVARVRENARVLGAIRAKQVDAMAERVVELESRVVQLRTRIAELSREAHGFITAAERELRRL